MKENENRLLEKYEESLLVVALQTGSKCPRAIIYLDLSIGHARFQVKKYKLNFLHYILNQHEDSLLFRFSKAYMESPTKGDLVSEVKAWICKYEIATSLKEVSKMKKMHMKKL